MTAQEMSAESLQDRILECPANHFKSMNAVKVKVKVGLESDGKWTQECGQAGLQHSTKLMS